MGTSLFAQIRTILDRPRSSRNAILRTGLGNPPSDRMCRRPTSGGEAPPCIETYFAPCPDSGIMYRCHVCRKNLGELPFTCQWCGQIFCFDHFMPENHHCSRPHLYDRNLHLRVCRNCGRELKGELVPCHRCGKVLCDHCRLPENHLCRDKFTGSSPRSFRSS